MMRDLRDQAGIVCVSVLESLMCRFSGSDVRRGAEGWAFEMAFRRERVRCAVFG